MLMHKVNGCGIKLEIAPMRGDIKIYRMSGMVKNSFLGLM